MRLRTIGLISILALGLLAAPLPAVAQEATKIPQVVYFSMNASRKGGSFKAFRQGLRELGYVDGQNIVIVTRGALRERHRLPAFAAELVRLNVDVIVTSSAPPTVRAAKQATRTIPIVMGGIAVDPVKAGFVVSLARPGGNITGLTNLGNELHGKRLELLKEVFPQVSHVAVFLTGFQLERYSKEIEAAGQALGIQIQSLLIRGDPESAFSAILHSARAQPRESNRGLLVPINSRTIRHRARIIEFTAKRRLPAIYARSRFVKAGGLMSYEADRQHLHRRVVTYVDNILKGAKPADLPVEQPTKFDLVINLKTAKALGLTIPPTLLLQAAKVIK